MVLGEVTGKSLHRQWCLGIVASEGCLEKRESTGTFEHLLAGRELVAVQGAELPSARFFSLVMPG